MEFRIQLFAFQLIAVLDSGDWSTGRNMFNTFDDFKTIKIEEKVE